MSDLVLEVGKSYRYRKGSVGQMLEPADREPGEVGVETYNLTGSFAPTDSFIDNMGMPIQLVDGQVEVEDNSIVTVLSLNPAVITGNIVYPLTISFIDKGKEFFDMLDEIFVNPLSIADKYSMYEEFRWNIENGKIDKESVVSNINQRLGSYHGSWNGARDAERFKYFIVLLVTGVPQAITLFKTKQTDELTVRYNNAGKLELVVEGLSYADWYAQNSTYNKKAFSNGTSADSSFNAMMNAAQFR